MFNISTAIFLLVISQLAIGAKDVEHNETKAGFLPSMANQFSSMLTILDPTLYQLIASSCGGPASSPSDEKVAVICRHGFLELGKILGKCPDDCPVCKRAANEIAKNLEGKIKQVNIEAEKEKSKEINLMAQKDKKQLQVSIKDKGLEKGIAKSLLEKNVESTETEQKQELVGEKKDVQKETVEVAKSAEEVTEIGGKGKEGSSQGWFKHPNHSHCERFILVPLPEGYKKRRKFLSKLRNFVIKDDDYHDIAMDVKYTNAAGLEDYSPFCVAFFLAICLTYLYVNYRGL